MSDYGARWTTTPSRIEVEFDEPPTLHTGESIVLIMEVVYSGPDAPAEVRDLQVRVEPAEPAEPAEQ